jgi:hypothetical protein
MPVLRLGVSKSSLMILISMSKKQEYVMPEYAIEHDYLSNNASVVSIIDKYNCQG